MKYHRPKTRGELRDKLLEGVKCEVVSSNTDTTVACLAWLKFWKGAEYDVRTSENKGWVVFYPIKA